MATQKPNKGWTIQKIIFIHVCGDRHPTEVQYISYDMIQKSKLYQRKISLSEKYHDQINAWKVLNQCAYTADIVVASNIDTCKKLLKKIPFIDLSDKLWTQCSWYYQNPTNVDCDKVMSDFLFHLEMSKHAVECSPEGDCVCGRELQIDF